MPKHSFCYIFLERTSVRFLRNRLMTNLNLFSWPMLLSYVALSKRSQQDCLACEESPSTSSSSQSHNVLKPPLRPCSSDCRCCWHGRGHAETNALALELYHRLCWHLAPHSGTGSPTPEYTSTVTRDNYHEKHILYTMWFSWLPKDINNYNQGSFSSTP